ncbi:MAG: hypothetical protein KGR26_06895 [Cyanobacteria bacterium REEB65]|nr:hypothetical protein [Cyanobacteria bacterium REEB65]
MSELGRRLTNALIGVTAGMALWWLRSVMVSGYVEADRARAIAGDSPNGEEVVRHIHWSGKGLR